MDPKPSRHVLYPDEYVWLVFVSSLDVMFTWIVLWIGGREANVLANAILYRFGLPGLVVFKFALVTLVVIICEYIGRRQRQTGQKLAAAAIAITCVPVLLAVLILLVAR